MSNTELQKETTVQNEQQLKSKQEIINDIIDVLLRNKGMSSYYGRELLREAMDTLDKTPIMYK